MGYAAAVLLLQLIDQQFPIDKIHVVGHSLGGQLAGYIGRSVMSQTGGSKKLKRLTSTFTKECTRFIYMLFRLTALDPAGPDFFAIRIKTEHITKNDAEFVDVVHTDAGFYGYPKSTGTADFWPNGGHRFQPECIDSFDSIYVV